MKLIRFDQWARPGTRHPGNVDMKGSAAYVFIHHAAGPTPINGAAEIALLRQYDAQHRAKGWDGLGYSFVIGPSGAVYEGRGQKVGAHTEGHNTEGYGVCFLGTFTDHVPTPAAMLACAQLIQHLIAVEAVRPDFQLQGHRQTGPTACPGNALFAALPQLRRLVNQKETPAVPENIDSPIYTVDAPPVGIAMTASGLGYVILCADGGVFAFGDAKYLGGVRVRAAGK